MQLRHLIATATSVLITVTVSCRVIDDYGPPAGWAIVTGKVSLPNGSAAEGVEVAFSRCDDPVGFLGLAYTNDAGEYRLEGALPPTGVMGSSFNVDTIQVRCRAFLFRDGVARDSLVVRFGPDRDTAPIHVLNLQLP